MDSLGEKKVYSGPSSAQIRRNYRQFPKKEILAATSKKGWITIIKKNYFESCHKKRVIYQNPPKGGQKKRSMTVPKALKFKILKS